MSRTNPQTKTAQKKPTRLEAAQIICEAISNRTLQFVLEELLTPTNLKTLHAQVCSERENPIEETLYFLAVNAMEDHNIPPGAYNKKALQTVSKHGVPLLHYLVLGNNEEHDLTKISSDPEIWETQNQITQENVLHCAAKMNTFSRIPTHAITPKALLTPDSKGKTPLKMAKHTREGTQYDSDHLNPFHFFPAKTLIALLKSREIEDEVMTPVARERVNLFQRKQKSAKMVLKGNLIQI